MYKKKTTKPFFWVFGPNED